MTPCNIRIDDRFIHLHGHPGDTTLCAMVTALTVSLVRHLAAITDGDVIFTADSGLFVLDKASIAGDYNAAACVDMVERALRDLAADYPENFKLQ